jgi:hypothetical protein
MSTGPKRWLGVPVWLFGMIAVAAFGCFLVLGGTSPHEPVSARTRTVVEGLRTTSVYEEPGGPGIVDAQRARDLIGDRAIVLVLLGELTHEEWTAGTGSRYDQCVEIADLIATSVVILYSYHDEDSYEAEYCVGPEFANADNPVDPEDYVVGVVGGVNLGTHFRVTDTDKFAEVEEYVYTFDHYTMRDSPNGVPRRGVVVPPPHAPGVLEAGQVALALGGVLTGTVALFALLRTVGGVAGRRTAREAESRTRSERINVRLNRLADTVLHPEPTTDATVARHQADLAERYVLLLAAVESAKTDAEYAGVDQDLTELEEALRK